MSILNVHFILLGGKHKGRTTKKGNGENMLKGGGIVGTGRRMKWDGRNGKANV